MSKIPPAPSRSARRRTSSAATASTRSCSTSCSRCSRSRSSRSTHSDSPRLLTLTDRCGQSCIGTEHVICRLSGKRESNSGRLVRRDHRIALRIDAPASACPLWMVAVGGILAVGVGKAIFGGLGNNPFNPALVGRALLQAAFPAAMTSWTSGIHARSLHDNRPRRRSRLPFTDAELRRDHHRDAALGMWKFDQVVTDTSDLALGFISGSAGETCGLLILIGGDLSHRTQHDELAYPRVDLHHGRRCSAACSILLIKSSSHRRCSCSSRED